MWTAAGTAGRRLLRQLDGVVLDDEPGDELDVLEVEVLLDEADDELSPDEELLEEDSLVDDDVDEDFLPESRLSVR